jgi:hypothetical protein
VVLKSVYLAAAVALVLAGSGVARADDYKPGEYLGLDLSKAVLSPKPLGPPTAFAPVGVEAKADVKTDQPARAALGKAPKKIATEQVRVAEPRVARVKRAEPRGRARTRLAHRHGNPLDAQAMDTRIQTWPCKSGGICNWKR